MEHFYNIAFSGILVGILVSAPMGPVGMLCIQRTLNKGRWAGFFTGVGAGVSDLLYSLLAGIGLSFVNDFIEANSHILEIVGSAVMIVFAIYLFQKNPSRALRKPKEKKSNFWADIVTGFLFTFSNPLILFFIIGLFGRFNFLLPEFQYYHYMLGYLSIYVGALVWWFLITFLVNKLRSHFNLRSMWILNRTVGSILMLMALVGIYNGITGFYS